MIDFERELKHLSYYKKLRDISKERIDDVTTEILKKGPSKDREWLLKYNWTVYERSKRNIEILQGGLQ